MGLFSALGSLVGGRGNAAPASRPVRSAPSSVPADADEMAFFEDDLYEDDDVAAAPPSHFERYRNLIDSFDEDREAWLEKLLRWVLLLLAYSLPLVVAYAMGKEIGDAYGGVFNVNDGWSLGTHVVAMAGELALTMMTFSAASALRKMSSDSSYTFKFAGSVVAFLVFALASGLAQWFIASHHIAPSDGAGVAALVFRVAMVPGVDIAALLFLAVMNFKSLKKFVADQRVRAQAIRDLNEAELEIQRAQSTARRRETEERQDMEMKEQRNAVWLELDRLHAQSMISDAQRRALPPASTTVTPDDAPSSDTSSETPTSEQVRIRRIDRSAHSS